LTSRAAPRDAPSVSDAVSSRWPTPSSWGSGRPATQVPCRAASRRSSPSRLAPSSASVHRHRPLAALSGIGSVGEGDEAGRSGPRLRPGRREAARRRAGRVATELASPPVRCQGRRQNQAWPRLVLRPARRGYERSTVRAPELHARKARLAVAQPSIPESTDPAVLQVLQSAPAGRRPTSAPSARPRAQQLARDRVDAHPDEEREPTLRITRLHPALDLRLRSVRDVRSSIGELLHVRCEREQVVALGGDERASRLRQPVPERRAPGLGRDSRCA
jgi:hypothetical protein